ncbi:hypothetical protein D3C78_1708520 [compost metagenome]
MGVRTMPNFYLRDGGADAKDLESFPEGLRKKLIVLHWGGVACIALLLALFAVNALGYIQ